MYPVSIQSSTGCVSPVSLSVSRIVNGSYPYFSAFPDASSLRARYGLVGISGTPVLLTTATAMSIPPFFPAKPGVAYAFRTRHPFGCPARDLYPLPVPPGKPRFRRQRSRLFSSPMLSDSLTHTALPLPSGMFRQHAAGSRDFRSIPECLFCR